jgi:hypothetical protein
MHAGMKRYFHGKHEEGLLSAQGLRILDYCCALAGDRPDLSFELWPMVEKEVRQRGRGRRGLAAQPD